MPSVLQAASRDPEHLARRYDGDIGMYNKMRNRISGRGGLELTETRTGAAPWWTPVNRARDLEACAHGRGCCQLWLREGVAKGSRLASAVTAPRAGRWETALRCAGRVGLFPLVLSGAFYT